MKHISTASLLIQRDCSRQENPQPDNITTRMLTSIDNTEVYFLRKMAHAQSLMTGLKINFSLPIVKA